jgi:hypothetical protein
MQETRYEASVLWPRPGEGRLDAPFRKRGHPRRDVPVHAAISPSPPSSITFPYEWGARYVYFRWTAQGIERRPGAVSIAAGDDRVLMASVDQAVDPEAAPAPPDLPAPPADWVAAGTDNDGSVELVSRARGEARTGTTVLRAPEPRAPMAGGPPGDLRAFRRATAFAWRINLANEATAARVHRTAAARLADDLVPPAGNLGRGRGRKRPAARAIGSFGP